MQSTAVYAFQSEDGFTFNKSWGDDNHVKEDWLIVQVLVSCVVALVHAACMYVPRPTIARMLYVSVLYVSVLLIKSAHAILLDRL